MSDLPDCLACPRCNNPLHGLRCAACLVDYPVIDGVAWLFADPDSALGDWRNRWNLALANRVDPLDLGRGLDFVVAHAAVDYLLPVRYGDEVEVRVQPEKVGRSSFSFTYDLHRGDGELALQARTVLVSYDWATSKSKELDPRIAAKIRAGCPPRGTIS